MTLSDMASYVCGKVRQTDAAAVARCKLFLRQRYEMIWNEGLWRASVFRHDFTFYPQPSFANPPPYNNYWCNEASSVEGSGGVQALPTMVDRVLALRREDAGVRVEQIETLFRSGIDEFNESGTAVKFLVLPAACVDIQRATYTDISSEGITITSAAGDEGAVLRVRSIDFYGEESVESITLNAGGSIQMSTYPQSILSVTKPVTGAAVTFAFDGDTLFTLAAADMAAKRYPRIRLLPAPTADTAFRCLVKKKCARLTDDNDEPELNGVDNALMGFAQGDLLQHARQYGKAQAVQQEAIALLEQFKRMEILQQATRQQVTPDVEAMSGDWETSKAWFA